MTYLGGLPFVTASPSAKVVADRTRSLPIDTLMSLVVDRNVGGSSDVVTVTSTVMSDDTGSAAGLDGGPVVT